MKNEENEKRIHKMGILYVLLLVLAGAAILYSTIKIQWIDGDMWRAKAASREHTIRTDAALRGNIYSSDGNVLASTIPVCDLYFDLGRMPKKKNNGKTLKDFQGNPIMESTIADSNFTKYLDSVCYILHEACPYHSHEYYRDLITTERAKDKPSRFFRVVKDMPYSYWLQLGRIPGWGRAIVKKNGYESIIHNIRAHTYGNLAENVIGFQNSRESNTYTGLEGYYDSILRGQDGKQICRRLTKGVWLPEDGDADGLIADSVDIDSILAPRIDGLHIVSTIDTRYQDIAESSLRKNLKQYNGSAGCAVLMEIETGYILACSNLTKDTVTGQYREMPNSNVATSHIYEPGSTFKTVILTAMMNDTIIDTAERVRVGIKQFPGADGQIQDSRGHDHVDTVSVKKVLALSSNVGMCELGWKYYRNNRLRLRDEVLRIFPYDALNVDIRAGESRTRINNIEASNRDFLNFCYGYSTIVSPLQVLTFYNALGGNGKMMKPLFCKQIIHGKDTIQIKPIVLKEKICSDKVAAIMKDLLVNVVEHGTGDNIKNSAYGIAGKTGTSVASYRNMKHYNASFAGFFPAENPKYTCLVVVEDIGFNGRQSAVVFKDIANCVMAMDKSLGNISLDYKKRELEEKNVSTEPWLTKGKQRELMMAYSILGLPYHSADSTSYWTCFTPGVDSLNTYSHYAPYQLPEQKIPDCKGMTIKDAMALCRRMGLKVKFTGCGKVIHQEPRGHSPYQQGATVYLTLGN